MLMENVHSKLRKMRRWKVSPVGPGQSGGLCQIPTLGHSVDISCSLALGATIGVAVNCGEEKRALSLPVLCVDGS